MHDSTFTHAVKAGACSCSNTKHPILCPPHYCDLRMPQGGHIPQDVYDYCECDCEEGWSWCGYYDEDGVWVTDSATVTSDAASDGSSSSNGGNKSTSGASVKSNWWIYVVGAAAVGMVAAAIIMRKRVR